MISRFGKPNHSRRERRSQFSSNASDRKRNARTNGSSDSWTCTEIANQLEVSEHEIFLQAYSWYYGGAEPASVDKAFKRYLMTGCEEVPHYVTHFARNWITTLLVA